MQKASKWFESVCHLPRWAGASVVDPFRRAHVRVQMVRTSGWRYQARSVFRANHIPSTQFVCRCLVKSGPSNMGRSRIHQFNKCIGSRYVAGEDHHAGSAGPTHGVVNHPVKTGDPQHVPKPLTRCRQPKLARPSPPIELLHGSMQSLGCPNEKFTGIPELERLRQNLQSPRHLELGEDPGYRPQVVDVPHVKWTSDLASQPNCRIASP